MYTWYILHMYTVQCTWYKYNIWKNEEVRCCDTRRRVLWMVRMWVEIWMDGICVWSENFKESQFQYIYIIYMYVYKDLHEQIEW